MLSARIRIGLLAASAAPMLCALGLPQKATAPTQKGADLYAKSCAPCHGVKGEGGAGFPKALTGARTVSELGLFISQSMPPGPQKTPLPQAKLIAEYIHGAFYSPLAQERNRPARVTLSRLTVRQFKNAVADLVGPYHEAAPQTSGGLKAQYFKNRDRSTKNRVLERVDPEVTFDFGAAAPLPEQEAHNFSVTWSGSVLAPETGEYELILQSDHATRLTFNLSRKPLVDAWVRSGNETDHRASANLIGGRAYPVLLEFSKATTGVNDDEKKKKIPPAPAHMRLMWRRPKGAPEPIPSRYLYPASIPATYVVDSPFPPDDRSMGFERGNQMNKAWDDASTAATLEVAELISNNLPTIARIPNDAPDRVEKLKAYCRDFLSRAFRRPLSKEIEQLYIDKQFQAAASPEVAVKRVVILVLKSPRFLYREIGARNDPYAIASELSFGLWDSLPDPELLRAAARGDLATKEGIRQQALRMANDQRAWTKLRDFLLIWLKVDEIPDIVKSSKSFPGFDDAAATDLRSGLELFLQNTAWSKEADFRQLLLSKTEYMNGRLSKLYGGSLPADAPFQPMENPNRSGVLTQPYLMSRFAYLENSSPIHRGVLVARSMLGRTLSPPPQAVTPLAASLHPSLTTRERIELQTKPAACNTCHGLINPLGFPFEKYDAIGRVRQAENGKAVDTSGSYVSRSGATVKFSDASELAKYLADSEEVHAAFAEKLFQHLTKQPVKAYGAKTLSNLEEAFKKDNYNIRSLMVSIMLAAT